MWKDEAAWIGSQIEKMEFRSAKVSCLNIGSSTKEYREVIKPYIYELVLKKIEKIGEIYNLDGKEGVGVDITGDLNTESFRKKIILKKYDLILCNNILTHVKDPEFVFEIIRGCLSDGGYVVVTAPKQYPFCADPYDSKYRPSIEDIESNLTAYETLAFARFNSTETHFARLASNRHLLISFLLNLCFPRRGFRVWKNTISDLKNIRTRFSAVGIILKNTGKSKSYIIQNRKKEREKAS